ncbi:NlpC/P60 family protein [uncultured Vagococcus sp.]|uniref:NlpC/P60 family protein n=1 Tax=uncultured Vagococcus sp. TaxID=189676 RepID=UPI0028D8AEDB|nr:NlpC/P60 family protein [uncultured Vagococcus sp.]
MKKTLKIAAMLLVLAGIGGTTAHATERQRDNTDDLNQALEAGFTIEQYTQIIAIPEVPNAETSQPFLTRAVMTTDQTKVLNMAKAQIGKPYAWGAQGPSSFDCGGLVRYVFKNAVGVDIPMGTTNQETKGKEVSLASLLPGDLLFYGSRGATYHVGVYAGNNQMIHAPQPGQNVTTVDIKYFYPSFARRILSDTPSPVVNQMIYTEISKTAMINRVEKEIDTLPWGQKGYGKLGTTSSSLGKVITLTQDSGYYAYSPELKGWIDKKGLDEVISVNGAGVIQYSGYNIDPVPWYAGVVSLGYTKDYLGKNVTVTARNGSYYYVPNLGWIDKKAFNIDLQKSVDSTPNNNKVTNTKTTITEINKTAKILAIRKNIDTLPWGMKGFARLDFTDNHTGKSIKITQDSGSYVFSPDLKGWIDKKALEIK